MCCDSLGLTMGSLMNQQRLSYNSHVLYSGSSSLFLLNANVKHHLEEYLGTHSETVTAILRSIYVHDVVFGAEDEGSVYKLYLKSKESLRNWSLNLSNFTTNCPSLQDKIDNAKALDTSSQAEGGLDETFAKTTLGGALSHKTSEQKILGVCWDTHSDCFVFELHELAKLATRLEPTKRNSMVGRFYDPMGVLSPVVSFKVLVFSMIINYWIIATTTIYDVQALYTFTVIPFM